MTTYKKQKKNPSINRLKDTTERKEGCSNFLTIKLGQTGRTPQTCNLKQRSNSPSDNVSNIMISSSSSTLLPIFGKTSFPIEDE